MINIILEEFKKLIGQRFFRLAIFIFYLLAIVITNLYINKDFVDIDTQNKEKVYVENYKTELKNSIENILENTGSPIIRNNDILKNSLLNQARAYEDLSNKDNLNIKYDHKKGLELTVNTSYLDIITIIVVCVSGFLIFNYERIHLTNNIINSIKNGGEYRAKSKIFLTLIISIITPFCVFAFFLLYINIKRGYGDLSRNIQSLIIFRDASLNLKVGQYLLIFIGQKILTTIYFAFILIFILSILKDIRLQIVSVLSFLLFSYLTYAYIGKNTVFDMLKYASVFSLFNVADIFARYSDVYIFVGFFQRYLYSIFLVLLISFISGFFAYKLLSAETDIKTSKKYSIININYPKKLFTFEAYRLFVKSYGILFLILISVYAFTHIPKQGPSEYDFVEYMYDYSINEFGGRVDSTTIANINNKKDYYQNIKNEIEIIAEKMENNQIDEGHAGPLLQDLEREYSKEIGFTIVEKQVNDSYRITDKDENLFLLDKEIGQYNFEYNPYVLITSIGFYLLIIFILSDTFIVDKNLGMDKLIKVSSKGHLKILKYRSILSYIYILLGFIVSQIFIFISASSLGYILDGRAIVQSVPSLLNFGLIINFRTLYLAYITYALVNIYLILNYIIYVNQILKNRIAIYLILILSTLLPNILALFFNNPAILGLLPTGNIFSINFTFSKYSMYGYLINLIISLLIGLILSKYNKKKWSLN